MDSTFFVTSIFLADLIFCACVLIFHCWTNLNKFVIGIFSFRKIAKYSIKKNIYINKFYCHEPRVCVNNKMGFGLDDRIYYAFIQLVTTAHKSLSDILKFSSDRTLHGNGTYSTFQLKWTPLYSVVLLQFCELRLCPLMTSRHGPHGKHHALLSVMRACCFLTQKWMSFNC
jgi:hypothetical protein